MTTYPLPQPGDVVTADGQAWAVVASTVPHDFEYRDAAEVTLQLRRVGPIQDRAGTVSERVTSMPAIARLVLKAGAR